MTEKIRVVHHSKSVGFSGTDRTAQLFCKYLAQSKRYEPFLVYREGDSANTRLDIAREWLGEDHVIPYRWVPGKKGRIAPFLPEEDNLYEVLQGIDPQIFHIHRSGYAEWPGFKYMCPKAKFIETNIFGYDDKTPERQIDWTIYISEFIRESALNAGNVDGTVLYNPIEQPFLDVTPENKAACRQELLDRFNLPENAILLGRVGRADNFDAISLRAMQRIEAEFPNTYYIVVNPCNRWSEVANQLGLKNVRYSGPIIDDEKLSKFYMGLDIYAHARNDGECCPCNIQEAMMHNVPVVSHESATYNGQSEIIGDAGFCVPLGDDEAYAACVKALIANGDIAVDDLATGLEKIVPIRNHFSRAARRRAMRYFAADTTTKLLTGIYDWVLENK